MSSVPVLLVDSGVVPATGGSWSPDLDKMQSLTRDHVVIEEMRVWARAATMGAAHTGVLPLSSFAFKLDVGRFSLLDDYSMPLGFGPAVERYGRGEFTKSTDATINNAATMRWRFPRPMAVEAGTPLRPIFRWQDPYGNLAGNTRGGTDVNITVAFIGRTIDVLPKTTPVPYAAQYIARQGYTDSQDRDLMNVCDRALNVNGLGIGLYMNDNTLNNNDDLWISEQLYSYSSWGKYYGDVLTGAAAASSDACSIKIYDASSISYVPQYTPLAQIGGTRQWLPTPGLVLQSRDYLRVQHMAAPQIASFKLGLPVVVLNGWREEALQ